MDAGPAYGEAGDAPPGRLYTPGAAPTDLVASAAGLGVRLDAEAEGRLRDLIELLREWNARFNLTSIRDAEDIAIKHVLDSLAPAMHGWRATDGRRPDTLLDVGSGAGFPALPLAIAFPETRVTALESTRKKGEFISLAAARLGRDVRVVNGRAETEGQRPVLRERFDLVLARAVAYLPALAEFCLPFTRVGGWFIAMKSESVDREIADGLAAVEALGGRLCEPIPYALPGLPGARWLLAVEKVSRTPPEYPRDPGVPKRKPIVR